MGDLDLFVMVTEAKNEKYIHRDMLTTTRASPSIFTPSVLIVTWGLDDESTCIYFFMTFVREGGGDGKCVFLCVKTLPPLVHFEVGKY